MRCMVPQIGEQAPDFELQNQDGQWVKLSDFRGKKVVLFIFPKANTGGCNAQACGFRDEFERISAKNAVVLGMSVSSPEVLKAWKIEKNLPYDLLSDPNKEILGKFSADSTPLFNIIRIPMVLRSYWVIDEDGIIIGGKAGIGPGSSVQASLQDLKIAL